MKPLTVMIMGRPNVGKSTIFNRLMRRRQAIVHNMPGVTRDRVFGDTQWIVYGKTYTLKLIDTGGLGGDLFGPEIEAQVDQALQEADVALAVFDGRAGFLPEDREILQGVIRRADRLGRVKERKIPIIGVVNKIDHEAAEQNQGEFYESGLEHIITISAEHDRGMDDLKDMIIDVLKETEANLEALEASEAQEGALETPEYPRIAIVGRPNVGKSSLLNYFLKQERMITSPMAGTTIDSVDSLIEWGGETYILTDTAGIRRKSKTEQGVEVLSVVQSKKALERSDIAFLVIDGETGPIDQDEKIAGLIEEAGCAVVILVNKWDTQKGNVDFDRETAAEKIRDKLAFMAYAPLLFVSALRGTGMDGLPDLVREILLQRQLKVSTHEFTEWVRKEATIHNPKNAKFYLSHQSGRHPPTFVCHVSDPKKIHFSLQRHLVNAIRARWGFLGSPIRLLFK